MFDLQLHVDNAGKSKNIEIHARFHLIYYRNREIILENLPRTATTQQKQAGDPSDRLRHRVSREG